VIHIQGADGRVEGQQAFCSLPSLVESQFPAQVPLHSAAAMSRGKHYAFICIKIRSTGTPHIGNKAIGGLAIGQQELEYWGRALDYRPTTECARVGVGLSDHMPLRAYRASGSDDFVAHGTSSKALPLTAASTGYAEWHLPGTGRRPNGFAFWASRTRR